MSEWCMVVGEDGLISYEEIKKDKEIRDEDSRLG